MPSILKRIKPDDPLMAPESYGITNFSLSSETIQDVGDIYHKRIKIMIEHMSDSRLEIAFDPGIRDYLNCKIQLPVNGLNNKEISVGAVDSYTLRTIKNNDNLTKKKSEYEIPSYYNFNGTVLDNQKIIFRAGDADVPISSQFNLNNGDDFDYYNSIGLKNINYNAQIIPLLLECNILFNVYERMEVLLCDYSNAIQERAQSSIIEWDMLTDSYQLSIDESLYHVESYSYDSLTPDLVQQASLRAIKKQISKTCQSYKDVLNGEATKSELLFYKVEKWFRKIPFDNPSKPDQVFIIPASKGYFDLIDTQILQDKNYSYRATAYYALTQIEYFFSEYREISAYLSEAIVESRPKITFHQHVFMEETVMNVFPPPMTPIVSFHTKDFLENKIRIYLESQAGEEHAYFQDIVEGEENKVAEGDILTEDGLIRFKHRSEPARFQIYRTMEKPNSYNDFEGKEIGFFENQTKLENMIVMDTVIPNTPYYYTFRAVNYYGSLSNPTPIFEVELIRDADNSKVLVNSVLIKEDNSDILHESMNFKSLLKIEVAESQLGFDMPGPTPSPGYTKQMLDDIKLSLSPETGMKLENQIWGRKFKFRVRSNDSGKIIDFNVKVNIVRDKS